jgi:hypothetical protein
MALAALVGGTTAFEALSLLGQDIKLGLCSAIVVACRWSATASSSTAAIVAASVAAAGASSWGGVVAQVAGEAEHLLLDAAVLNELLPCIAMSVLLTSSLVVLH